MYVLSLFPMERLVDRRSHFFPKLMNVGINPVTYIVPCNFHPSGNPRRRPLNFSFQFTHPGTYKFQMSYLSIYLNQSQLYESNLTFRWLHVIITKSEEMNMVCGSQKTKA